MAVAVLEHGVLKLLIRPAVIELLNDEDQLTTFRSAVLDDTIDVRTLRRVGERAERDLFVFILTEIAKKPVERKRKR